MKTLITPTEVLRHAFPGAHCLTEEFISQADIAAAEARFLVPVVGPKLYERLVAGDYAELREEYLTGCVALFVRMLLQPRLDLTTTSIGTLQPRTEQGSPPDKATLARLQNQLRTEAHSLLRRASDHLEANRDQYPEYNPETNPLNRCTIYGGYLQIH